MQVAATVSVSGTSVLSELHTCSSWLLCWLQLSRLPVPRVRMKLEIIWGMKALSLSLNCEFRILVNLSPSLSLSHTRTRHVYQ